MKALHDLSLKKTGISKKKQNKKQKKQTRKEKKKRKQILMWVKRNSLLVFERESSKNLKTVKNRQLFLKNVHNRCLTES